MARAHVVGNAGARKCRASPVPGFSLAAITMFLASRRRRASGAGGLVVANVCSTAAMVLASNSKEWASSR